jgi:mannose-6-phosphate isomerase-like protein (cupin superfamily)
MRKIVTVVVMLTAMFGLLGYMAVTPAVTTVPEGPKPVVALKQVAPVAQAPGLRLATWTITFPHGAAIQAAVSHADTRQVMITKGTMMLISDDQPNKTKVFEVGDTVTISAGAMHQWANRGAGIGELTAVGVVTPDKLYDACGGAS